MAEEQIGYLVDVQGSILLENCSKDDALNWLRRYGGRGWRGGRTVWLPYHEDNGVEFEDADREFAEVLD